MPTFHFYKNSQKIAELQGANAPKLQQLVQEHSTPSSSSSSTPSSNPTSGQQLGSRGGSNPAQDEIQKELLEMGFEQPLITAARNSTPFNSLQDVIEWIMQQQSSGEQLGGTAPLPHVPTSTSAPAPAPAPESIPSEVPTQNRSLTPEEIEHQNRLLDQRLQDLRAKKAKEDEERDHNREIMRRKSGKESQDALKKWEDEKSTREIEAVRKEKEMEKQHKESVRRKVEQNKINRAQKNSASSSTPTPTPTPSTSAPPSSSTPTATTQSNSDSLIQLRLPNGQATQASFQATDSLQTVADHVGALLGVDSSQLTLSTTYPRHSYTSSEFSKGLAEIGVFPRGQIIVKQ